MGEEVTQEEEGFGLCPFYLKGKVEVLTEPEIVGMLGLGKGLGV